MYWLLDLSHQALFGLFDSIFSLEYHLKSTLVDRQCFKKKLWESWEPHWFYCNCTQTQRKTWIVCNWRSSLRQLSKNPLDMKGSMKPVRHRFCNFQHIWCIDIIEPSNPKSIRLDIFCTFPDFCTLRILRLDIENKSEWRYF